MRRLAAAHLNLVPAGTTPVLIASTRQATVTDWIGRSVVVASAPRPPQPMSQRSWLTSLTAGSGRLWVIGAGVLVVFVGLLMDGRPAGAGRAADPRALPRRCRSQRPRVTSEVEWSGDGAEDDDDDDWEEDDSEDLDEEESDEAEDEEELDDDAEEDEDEDEEELDDDEEEEDEEELDDDEEEEDEEELDDDEEDDDDEEELGDDEEWEEEEDEEETDGKVEP
jgi:hypothetical protein